MPVDARGFGCLGTVLMGSYGMFEMGARRQTVLLATETSL